MTPPGKGNLPPIRRRCEGALAPLPAHREVPTVWNTAAHGSVRESDAKVEVIDLANLAAGLARVLETNVQGTSAKVECSDGMARPFSWVLVSALISAVLENWADGVDQWGVLWAVRAGSYADHNGVAVTTPAFFSTMDATPFFSEGACGRERLAAVRESLEVVSDVPELRAAEWWEKFARTSRAGDSPGGQEYLGLIPLWEAMRLGEHLATEMFSAERFRRRIQAVSITSRTIESSARRDDAGVAQRRLLTLGDVAAAGAGVLICCGMRFRGPGDIWDLGEAIAKVEEKRGSEVVELDPVAAGLARVLETNVQGTSAKVECFDGVARPFSWVLVSALISAVLENWADGVDHWGVASAIRSLSHVDYVGALGVKSGSWTQRDQGHAMAAHTDVRGRDVGLRRGRDRNLVGTLRGGGSRSQFLNSLERVGRVVTAGALLTNPHRHILQNHEVGPVFEGLAPHLLGAHPAEQWSAYAARRLALRGTTRISTVLLRGRLRDSSDRSERPAIAPDPCRRYTM
jgi:hypothetical protein